MRYQKMMAVMLGGLVILGTGGQSALFAAPAKKSGAKKPQASQKKSSALPYTGRILDGFESVADWSVANHELTTISTSKGTGRRGSALKIDYDLKNSKQWVVVFKTFNLATIGGQSLSFAVKGTGAANALEVKLTDEDGSNFGVKKMGLTNTTDWVEVTINDKEFSYLWGGDNKLQSVKDISFAISAGDGGSGQVFLDDLKVGPVKQASVSKDGVIDSGDSIADWVGAQADNAQLRIVPGTGKEGKSVVLDYSFPADQWVAMRKKFLLPLDPMAVLVLTMHGEGSANNVEFKIVDNDGSVFGKTFEGAASSTGWKEFKIPLWEMQYLWGGDNKLDVSGSFFVDFAVSGPGGKGKVFMDSIKIFQ